MRLKIRDTILICKVANKYLIFCERDKVVEWIKKESPRFPYRPVNRQFLYKIS